MSKSEGIILGVSLVSLLLVGSFLGYKSMTKKDYAAQVRSNSGFQFMNESPVQVLPFTSKGGKTRKHKKKQAKRTKRNIPLKNS
jgi:hypothetical protein